MTRFAGSGARGRWRRSGRLARAAASVVVLAVLAAGGWLVYLTLRPDLSCGPGVRRAAEGAECFGVSDGRHSFARDLDAISARIAAQNARAVRFPYVSIALMLPMSPPESFERRKILEQVQGAYLAQYAANEKDNDKNPRIRLLLASPGRDHAHWRAVADDLARRAASAENLRVVIGFDVSTAVTREAIRHLTVERRIPVVAGPVTAENIGPHPGFARIVPTTRDQADALAHFDQDTDPRTALVVEDKRTDDDYITSLRGAFRRLARGAPRAPEIYESPRNVNDDGNTSTVFGQMVNSICGSRAKTLYFAGRPVQLRQFLNELGHRPCAEKTYRVVTGSGASTIIADRKLDWPALTRGVTLQYAAPAHPDAWSGPGRPATGGSPAAFQALTRLAREAERPPAGPVGPIVLTDSRTIITYDATTTAIQAVRANATQAQPVAPLDQIRNAWLRVRGPNKVVGVSGWICLDNQGNPYDKAVAVVQLRPATRDLGFVGLAWPRGAPPESDCTAPTDDGT